MGEADQPGTAPAGATGQSAAASDHGQDAATAGAGRAADPAATGAPSAAAAGGTAVQQAAAFLAGAVHAEVDGAQVGPARVLGTADGRRVYAAAVVRGPLRAYLATAWGPAGGVNRKEIVSYPDMPAAQAALDAVVARQSRQGYQDLGTADGET